MQGNFAKTLLLFDEILSKGFNALYFVAGLGNHLRNLLVCKNASTLKLLEMAPAVAQRYRFQSGNCSVKFLYEALGNTTKCESEYRQSSNQRLLVEFLLVKLAQLNVQQEEVNVAVQPQIAAQPQAQLKNSPELQLQPQNPVQPQHSEPLQPQNLEQPQNHVQLKTTGYQQVMPEAKIVQPQVKGVPSGGEPLAPEVTSGGVQTVEGVHQADASKGAGEKVQGTKGGPLKASQGGLSIKDIIKKTQSAPETAKQEVVSATEPVTPERLKEAWIRMADAQTQYPRLAIALKQAEPVLQEDKVTIHFNVGNSAQQSWIEKNSLPSLIGFLQRELKNGDIKLVVGVTQVEQQEKKLYMPHEKADFLYRNNPELVALSKDLDLDIK